MRTTARFMVPVLARRGVNLPSAGGVPAAPTSLVLTAAGSDQIDGTFTNNATNAIGIEVWYSETEVGGYTLYDTLAGDADSFSITGLTSGTEYFAYLIATNANGDSAPSNVDSATTEAVIVGDTYDTSPIAANITLSNGNRTATTSGTGTGFARSTASKNTGKWVVDVLIDVNGVSGLNSSGVIGLVTPSSSATANYIGQSANSFGLWVRGNTYAYGIYGGASSANLVGPGIAAGTYVRLAWDADTGELWIAFDNTYADGDPAAGTDPTYSEVGLQGQHYFASGMYWDTGEVTVQESPVYALPSGFSYWTP